MAITSTYYVNKIFEADLKIDFIIGAGVFNTDGQFFIMQHAPAAQNVVKLDSFTELITGTIDSNNYFTREIRWSFNAQNWTSWVNLTDPVTGFPTASTQLNTWFQIKYTWHTNAAKTVTLQEVNLLGKRKVDPIFDPSIIGATPVVFTNADTYKVFNITDFIIYPELPSTGINIQFRYTQTQGRIWSPWYRLTKENLVSIKFDKIKFCNFQFGFQNTTGTPWSLYDLELVGEFQNITAAYATTAKFGLKTQCNPLLVTPPPTGPCDTNCMDGNTYAPCTTGADGKSCCAACSDCAVPWSIYTGDCGPKNGINADALYKKNTRAALGNRPALNAILDAVSSVRNGWTVTYGLSDPEGKGTDIILHEHQLSNIIMTQNIDVIVPNNQFPNSGVSLSTLDLDLLQTFEVHIVKEQFKNKFGVEFRPGTMDIMYLCDWNQMWEVDTIIPERRAFNQETYWRVTLIKYSDRKSRKFTNAGDKSLVDALTKHTSLNSLFGMQEDAEYQKVSQNANTKIDNTSQLFSHQSVNTVVNKVGAKVQYLKDLVTNGTVTLSETQYGLPLTSKGLKLVEYNPTDRSMKGGDNRGISMWFKTDAFENEWDWTLFSNYDYTNAKGYKLDMLDGSMNFTVNSNTWQLPLNSMIQPNTWYCILINLHQQQETLEMVVYKRQQEDGYSSDSKLLQVLKMEWIIVPQEFSHTESMFVGGVDLKNNNASGLSKQWYLTNIRVYKQNLPKGKRNVVLNEKVPNDAHLTLLCDNAETFKMDDYGNI